MTKGKYAAEVLEYAQSVAEGRKVACREGVLGCKRFLRMLEDERFEVRTRDADFVIGIIERTFKHRQGEKLDGTPLRGKPLLLEIDWPDDKPRSMGLYLYKPTNGYGTNIRDRLQGGIQAGA